jgi:hypothetical protein
LGIFGAVSVFVWKRDRTNPGGGFESFAKEKNSLPLPVMAN